MGKLELYENTYKKKKHFSFGENWKEYLQKLDEKKISEAKKSLVEFLGDKNKIKGKTFVDIGCGSGLFSLAAFLLGAKKVVSVDVDDSSIYCAQLLKKKYAKNTSKWTIKKGSALDNTFIKSLGEFDIVYSWGVLHHTGNMRKAFKNINLLCKPEGLIYLAIYNNNGIVLEGTSKFWSGMKRKYNKYGKFRKKAAYYIYTTYLLAGMTASGKNPVKYIKNYNTLRGMNFFTDIKDWLGGYPYEYATISEIKGEFGKLNYSTIKTKQARSLGCNEFLLKKGKK